MSGYPAWPSIVLGADKALAELRDTYGEAGPNDYFLFCLNSANMMLSSCEIVKLSVLTPAQLQQAQEPTKLKMGKDGVATLVTQKFKADRTEGYAEAIAQANTLLQLGSEAATRAACVRMHTRRCWKPTKHTQQRAPTRRKRLNLTPAVPVVSRLAVVLASKPQQLAKKGGLKLSYNRLLLQRNARLLQR